MIDQVKELFLERNRNADNISDMNDWRMGMSLTATWAWGISIAIGITIMHSKGMLPFIIWVIPNILAIPFFAFVHAKVPGVDKWTKWRPFLLFILSVIIYAILMNLQFINLALSSSTDLATFQFLTSTQSTYAVIGIGLLIALFINKTGFRGSVLTDIGQYSTQILGALSIIIAGLVLGTRADIVWVVEGTSDWWLSWSALSTLFAIMTHGGEWQRMQSLNNADQKLRVGAYGGLFFGFYMLLVAGAGLVFEGTLLMSLFFLIIVLSVATSSLDSSVSAAQWIFQQFNRSPYWGTLFAIAVVLVWPFAIESSVMEFYQLIVDIRMKIIGGLLGITVVYAATTSEKFNYLVKKYGILRDSAKIEQ
jgi:hypothetical protein